MENETILLSEFLNKSILIIADCYSDYCINEIKSYFNKEIINIEECILDRAYKLHKKK